jgi:hypothetical protein
MERVIDDRNRRSFDMRRVKGDCVALRRPDRESYTQAPHEI